MEIAGLFLHVFFWLILFVLLQRLIGDKVMATTSRAGLVARDTILKLLSDEETARVSTAEAASGLSEGQEYLDLERLELGVLRAKASSKVEMGHIIPRSGVRDETWSKILSLLAG